MIQSFIFQKYLISPGTSESVENKVRLNVTELQKRKKYNELSCTPVINKVEFIKISIFKICFSLTSIPNKLPIQ